MARTNQKPRKTLSNWLTNRYLLIIRNEENFAEKTTIGFTYAKIIFFTFLMLMVLMFGSLYLARTLMAQWFDPGHELIIMDRHLINFTTKVDSLEQQLNLKDQYLHNIQRVLMGESIDEDSLYQNAQNLQINPEIDNLTPIDSQFRKEFEASEISFLASGNPFIEELDDYFFSPIDGIVTRGFDAKIDHYGVDIVSATDEPVKAVSEGTVIFADWSQESGNVIAIQHRGNLISVYKHNSALLKKVGNFVNSGEVIAIIGNTGELTTGPHLHFEMWFNGNPVDPEEFISFN
jgi:murein DD-endopeptidase MepM/ murein hydrolase activator NlpD